jgi:hypothetical protein
MAMPRIVSIPASRLDAPIREARSGLDKTESLAIKFIWRQPR